MTPFLILGALIALIVVGVPIAIALGVTAVGTYVVSGETYGYLAAEDVGSVKSDAIELVEIRD